MVCQVGLFDLSYHRDFANAEVDSPDTTATTNQTTGIPPEPAPVDQNIVPFRKRSV
jgi:hypothetical protein